VNSLSQKTQLKFLCTHVKAATELFKIMIAQEDNMVGPTGQVKY
jgi:hypothetical protein